MKLYNTRSREKEDFKPIAGESVGIYSCGPTVYQYAHIGNMRTYICMDFLRRTLKLNGYKLRHVMNITDVGHLVSDGDEGEDKLAKSAREQNRKPYELAEFYTGVFMSDLAALGIEKPEYIPKATDNIEEMLDFVKELCRLGYGYEISDGIYFDISRFERYGKLSGQPPEEQQAGARVEVNPEKRNPADFALWKKAPPEHIMQWPSPWGMGYPGWHIECSAMSRKLLGDNFDIHTGGVDHIPVHHENEIAQSEALTGSHWVNYWVHSEFMMVDGGKMSKSLGNAYTLADLTAKGYKPMHFRYFCANAHYRNKINFTWESMNAAKTSYERLKKAVQAHESGQAALEGAKEHREAILDALSDDLNIPKALGMVWNLARLPEKSHEVYELAMEADAVFGLSLAEREAKQELSAELEALVREREAARARKDWAEADRIRELLKSLGYNVADKAVKK